MRKQLLMGSLAAIMAGATIPALAEDVGAGFDVSANVGLVSDYLWRGVSQSDGSGAIQGGVDVKHSSGAYVGTWMSSLNTGFADAEQDLYAGYGLSLTKDIALDLRYTTFTYPGVAADDFSESHVGLSGYGATLSVDYSTNVLIIGSSLHYSVGYSLTLPMDISLSATVGHYDFKGDLAYGNEDAYDYWNVGVSKKLLGLTWGLSYNDTNLSDSNCAAGAAAVGGDNDSCGSQVVLSATKAL